MSAPPHRYRTELAWRGSTGAGYAAYDRTHEVSAPPAGVTLSLSADPTFRGDPERLNPEQLLLAAASSCQMLSPGPGRARAHRRRRLPGQRRGAHAP